MMSRCAKMEVGETEKKIGIGNTDERLRSPPEGKDASSCSWSAMLRPFGALQ